MYYSDLEPWDEVRADYRAASVVQALWNIHRDTKKHPIPFTIKTFLLKFGIGVKEKKKHQTWQEQKQIMELWKAVYADVKPDA
jgi:hypothetical protein